MAEFKIYHVARNVARHNSALDDRLYGTPYPQGEIDWTLVDPELYVKRVRSELSRVNNALDDLAYLLREKGCPQDYDSDPGYPTIAEADAHAFHSFTVRQFGYVEKLSHQLQSRPANQIDLIIPKAIRQFNILLAAREDLMATSVRYTNYIHNNK